MAELMSSTGGLCTQIAGIIAIDRRLNRQTSGDLNARSSQAVDLGRIVREQDDALDSEHFQHAARLRRSRARHRRTKRGVCVDSV